MISAPIALAFTAGMVATFNPCGFSLLPAYIGAFVAGDETGERTDRRVFRAIGVAAAVSVGFVIVFAGTGLIIDSIAGEARRQLPWVTILIGSLLIVAGIATLAGWKPNIAIRVPVVKAGGSSAGAMVAYGATYAIASLSCTIGPFLAVTGAALNQSPLEGIATYVSYALGMGVIILALSVASALAHSAVANHMRQISRFAPTFGGTLMILAGAYAIWYGRWELAVYGGDLDSDPIIDKMEQIRISIIDFVQTTGATRLAAIIVIVIGAIVLAARVTRPTSGPPTSATPSEKPKSLRVANEK